MNVQLLASSVAVVSSIGVLWWGLTARPSAARANLLAGLPEEADEADSSLVELSRRAGAATRRVLPRPLVDGLEVNMVQAGYPGGLDLPRILGVKVALAASSFLATLVLGANLVIALIVAVAMFFLPDYWVLSTRDKRQAEIRSAAADVIDQLTICVEAGLGFDAALARVASSTEGALTEELSHTLHDIRAGVPRSQALRALADRVQIDEIRQLVTALLQAQKHGVSIAETLRIQSSEMRTKRRQNTEERAAKLTVKMIFPIVVCFLPVFLIIVMTPALISLFSAL